MVHVAVAVGDHRPAAVPTPATNYVHPSSAEGVRVAYHGADVEVVYPVLDGHVVAESTPIEFLHYRLDAPVAELIDDVAPVAVAQQFRIETLVLGPRDRMGAHTHLLISGRGTRPFALPGRGVLHDAAPYRCRVDTMQPTQPDPQQVTILVAHGSRNPTAQVAHEQLAESLESATGIRTRPAYLEMTEPTISGAIHAAVADGATEIFVLPCFLHPGNHVLVDIPRILERSREHHREVRIDTGRHLGAMPALVDLLAEEVSRRRTQTVD